MPCGDDTPGLRNMTTMSERDAYRAAAQGYIAAVLGLPIKHVDVNGIELGYAANDGRPAWDDLRAEVASASQALLPLIDSDSASRLMAGHILNSRA